MDRSWIRLHNRLCKEYVDGVKSFMDATKGCKDENNCVRCPCQDYQNAFFKPLSIVQAYLYKFEIATSYDKWIFHGEEDEFLTSLNFVVKLMHLKVLNQWTNKSMDMLLDLLKSTLPEGYKACSVCNEETSSLPLRRKICYMGHWRYLPSNHP
ncbi:hypothetical protein ACOSP7_018646 [Xanthoceras sorbifolium]